MIVVCFYFYFYCDVTAAINFLNNISRLVIKIVFIINLFLNWLLEVII